MDEVMFNLEEKNTTKYNEESAKEHDSTQFLIAIVEFLSIDVKAVNSGTAKRNSGSDKSNTVDQKVKNKL
jgi:hypothetical protein